MKADQFCYWLQGYFELTESDGDLSSEQVEIIQNHLNLVFVHDLDPKQVAEKLQQIHDGVPDHMDPLKNPDGLIRC